MKRCLFAFLFALISCQNGQRDVIDLPNESPMVYSVVLDLLADSTNRNMVYVVDSTIQSYTLVSMPQEYKVESWKGDSIRSIIREMIPGWQDLTSTQVPIIASELHFRVPFALISLAQTDTMLSLPTLGLSKGTGIAALSRVAYSTDSLYALVLVEMVNGRVLGSGQFLLLKKEHFRWRVLGSIVMWMS